MTCLPDGTWPDDDFSDGADDERFLYQLDTPAPDGRSYYDLWAETRDPVDPDLIRRLGFTPLENP